MKNKSFSEYQKEVLRIVEKFNFNWSNYVQYIHLVEEVAELGEALTVHEGDRKSGGGEKALADHNDIKEELGDILFTVLQIANQLNVDLGETLEETFKRYSGKLEKLNEYHT